MLHQFLWLQAALHGILDEGDGNGQRQSSEKRKSRHFQVPTTADLPLIGIRNGVSTMSTMQIGTFSGRYIPREWDTRNLSQARRVFRIDWRARGTKR